MYTVDIVPVVALPDGQSEGGDDDDGVKHPPPLLTRHKSLSHFNSL